MRISRHAAKRAAQRRAPPYIIRRALAAAIRHGGNGAFVANGWTVVVKNHTVLTVLAPGMTPGADLFVYNL